jgi:hypothetical protein
MRADNSAHLAAAAHQRSEAARRRATDTLRRLDQAGHPITFAGVAQAAEVSRSWLYRDADLRAEVDRLRAEQTSSRLSRPASERGTQASQHHRIAVLLDANRELRKDNHELRAHVALLLGQRRDELT